MAIEPLQPFNAALADPVDPALMEKGAALLEPPSPFNEARLLEIFKQYKEESFAFRYVWEREWLRDLWYIANRQWIYWNPSTRVWSDKKLAKWMPRPVTNRMNEVLRTLHATLGAINLAVVARPVGHDTESIAAAEVVDQLSPLIHEEHLMSQVMREADFWFLATGNSCLQISWDTDTRFNKIFLPSEQCLGCGAVVPSQQVVQAGNACPTCGGTQLTPAKNPDGTPAGEWKAFGKGKTTALSPFEYAFPPNVTRWDDLPYIIRLRWRDKHWFEANQPDLVKRITWEKSPQDRSLQIFKSLALTNDIGTGSQFSYFGASGSGTVEGVTEYELWARPTQEFPQGLVMRVIGDTAPVVLQLPDEGIPGPFPYKDIEGNPLFPFEHAQYEHMGGRLWGRSAISPLIQKQDQLNQLDSLIQLHVQRNANGGWVVPEGAGIENITGEPGLIIRWNPLAAGGNAAGKPERVAGLPIDASLMAYREQIMRDIEELSGAADPLKGEKPKGIEAFSALQLLVERSQSRLTPAFQARGELYRRWFSLAIELERQFGPQSRTFAVIGPNKGYTFRHFENAQLQHQITCVVEDGTNMPKTALGKRAAIEQANQLGLINPNDPDQKYALLSNFGLTDLVPSLNYHVQAALQLQDAFEQWIEMPQGPSPLVVKPWFDLAIHISERIKWLNTDRMREIIASNPDIEQIVTMHLMQMQALMMPPPTVGPDGQPQETPGGQAMNNSNSLSGATAGLPSGNSPAGNNGQNVGPA